MLLNYCNYDSVTNEKIGTINSPLKLNPLLVIFCYIRTNCIRSCASLPQKKAFIIQIKLLLIRINDLQ